MNAREIEAILKRRHTNDVFIPQCKTGGTSTGVLIMDAWAMRPSWSSPLTTGYEIKVSRGDFLRDQKWRGYLPYCNEFYFVTPKGLIDPSELPTEVGLLYVVGPRTVIKKKAMHRATGNIEDLLKYVIFWHSGLVKNGNGVRTKEDRIAEMEKAVQDRKDLSLRGVAVSTKLRQTIRERIQEVEYEINHLKRENENLAVVRKILDGLGIDHVPSEWSAERTIKLKLEEIERGLPNLFLQHLTGLRAVIDKIEQAVEPTAKDGS